MYRSAQRVGVAHQAHKTNGKIIGMGGRPQRRAVAGDDNGFARPDAGQRLPAAACAVQRHHGLAAAIGVAGAHDSHRKAFLPVPLHQEIFAGDLIAGILPVRVCQGGAFGDGQRGHGLLVCRRAADKNVLGRAPRKQAHVTLDVLLGKGDEIHRHVEPLVSQCGLHRSFVMDVRCTAFKANALGPRNLAQAAEKTGARLVHVSTDYVFSGRENGGVAQDEATIPGPISAYGSTKLMGEKYVEQFCHRHFIVRTAWLYSYYGKNFVKTIVNAGKKFGKLEVVNDQCGNPTNAVDLAHEILQLCVTHEYGLYHCTGEGICSWYDFASEIIRLSGVDATVAPCTSEEYKAKHPESADRPKWSALDNRMLRCTVGNDVRDWRDALACFFAHWDGDNGMKD